MNDDQLEQERRRQSRLQRLGSDNPVCTLCGEANCLCLELHHVTGHGMDEATAIVCRNCHRKLSDAQLDAPRPSAEPDKLETIGHFLIGLAEFFALLIKKLREFGQFLIDQATERKADAND